MKGYRNYCDSYTKVEFSLEDSVRTITSSMGIPYSHRFRLIGRYEDAYIIRRDYRVDGTGVLFSITDITSK